MNLPEPTMKLISWAMTRTAEAVVERAADRIVAKLKAGVVTSVRRRVAVTAPNCRGSKA